MSTAKRAMLAAPPPATSTSAPGRVARCGATARQASGRLSERLATVVEATWSGRGTSIASAKGTRTRSDIAPPHWPRTGTPYIAPTGTAVQLAVIPRRQRSHSPQLIENGTVTRAPGATLRTSSPTSTTSATNSWPRGKGPGGVGAPPEIIQRSRSQVVATTGRTSAWPRPSSAGAGTSCHSSRPGPRKVS